MRKKFFQGAQINIDLRKKISTTNPTSSHRFPKFPPHNNNLPFKVQPTVFNLLFGTSFCIIESNAIRSQEIQRERHLEPLSTSQSGRKTSYENKHVIRNIKRNTFHRKKLSTLWISSENIFQFSNLDLKVVVRKNFFQGGTDQHFGNYGGGKIFSLTKS